MLKFRGTGNGRQFLGLVLEAGNLMRLRQGHPIHILKEEMSLPFDIVIHYTDDIAALEARMRKEGMVDEHTVIHDQRERKRQ